MIGVEQWLKAYFLGDPILLALLSKDRTDGVANVYLDHIPEFEGGLSENLPLVIIWADDVKDSLFYDGQYNAKDVTFSIGIGAVNYQSAKEISERIGELMSKSWFFLLSSDSFNDTTEGMIGSRLKYRNGLFQELN